MKLLALDFSTTQTGWAFGPIEKGPYPEAWGSFTAPKNHRPSRIAQTVKYLGAFIRDPETVRFVAEDIAAAPFKRKDGTKGNANFKTGLILAELRGAFQFELWNERGIELELANQSTVKSTLALNKSFSFKGTPNKDDLRIIFDQMGMVTENTDESDAIAVWIASSLKGVKW